MKAGFSRQSSTDRKSRSSTTSQRPRSARPSSRCLEAAPLVSIPTTNPERLAFDCEIFILNPVTRSACQTRSRGWGPAAHASDVAGAAPGNLLRMHSDMSSVHSGASKRKTSWSRHTTLGLPVLQGEISCLRGMFHQLAVSLRRPGTRACIGERKRLLAWAKRATRRAVVLSLGIKPVLAVKRMSYRPGAPPADIYDTWLHSRTMHAPCHRKPYAKYSQRTMATPSKAGTEKNKSAMSMLQANADCRSGWACWQQCPHGLPCCSGKRGRCSSLSAWSPCLPS